MTTLRPSRTLICVGVAGLAAAALVLSGCSKGDSPTNTSTEWTPGPLDEYLSQIYGWNLDDERSTEELQNESDQQNRQVEEKVAACMAEQGFEYIPSLNNGGVFYGSDDLDVEWGTLEFAQQYGYGISTNPWGDGMPADTDEWVDPNQEYVDAMSESERVAYEEALWGPPVEYSGDEEETYEYNWEQSGCYGVAQHEVYGNTDTDVSDQFSSLSDEVDRFWEGMYDSPAYLEANASWASCMADAGYSGLTDPNNAEQGLYDEYSTLQGWNDPDYNKLAENWDWEAEPEGPPLPEVNATAVKAFTEKEISQAVADFTCRADTKYDATVQEIYLSRQQDFVDQHRAELDAWVEAANSARGN